MSEHDELIHDVATEMDRRGLDDAEAAREVGVGQSTLRRHLAGAYIRSDSAAKYRLWLNGTAAAGTQDRDTAGNAVDAGAPTEQDFLAARRLSSAIPAQTHRVVDLFSGAGGLSLGFDLFGGGSVFETVLAVDYEASTVKLFEHNLGVQGWDRSVARLEDLSQFMTESEVLAYYLDHLARLNEDRELSTRLDELAPLPLSEFVDAINTLDAEFLAETEALRASTCYRKHYGATPSTALKQTSVQGFHSALGLPQTSLARPALGTMLWHRPGGRGVMSGRVLELAGHLEYEVRRDLESAWDLQVALLEDRTGGSGPGQLASSAEKISAFLRLLDSPSGELMREGWLSWRARRDSLRMAYFASEDLESGIRVLYRDGNEVSVLLGGPPCQGFSRIGRGKLRSLRDSSVQVHYDPTAGDARNRLMHAYVMFVGALEPDVFLFENVRHFQTDVKAPDGCFSAPDVLAEAIENLTRDGMRYRVSHRIVAAAEHAIPQIRERFFMAGVVDRLAEIEGVHVPAWVLALPKHGPVPLREALVDLPPALPTGGPGGRAADLSAVSRVTSEVAPEDTASTIFRRWIRQAVPGTEVPPSKLDAHHARRPRDDDAKFFDLMGPGARWMDYRCDSAETLAKLQNLLGAVADRGGELASEAEVLLSKVDGSLSTRLILESIEPQPGELDHHLAKPTYLRKEEGNHGDWLARLDPKRPSKTIVSHMAKDSYAYVHPWEARTLSVREAARIQTFPDWFEFGCVGLVDAFRAVGNAVPPLLSHQLAERVAELLAAAEVSVASPRPTSVAVA